MPGEDIRLGMQDEVSPGLQRLEGNLEHFAQAANRLQGNLERSFQAINHVTGIDVDFGSQLTNTLSLVERLTAGLLHLGEVRRAALAGGPAPSNSFPADARAITRGAATENDVRLRANPTFQALPPAAQAGLRQDQARQILDFGGTISRQIAEGIRREFGHLPTATNQLLGSPRSLAGSISAGRDLLSDLTPQLRTQGAAIADQITAIRRTTEAEERLAAATEASARSASVAAAADARRAEAATAAANQTQTHTAVAASAGPSQPPAPPWAETTYRVGKLAREQLQQIQAKAEAENVDPGFRLRGTRQFIVTDPSLARTALGPSLQAAEAGAQDTSTQAGQLNALRAAGLRRLVDAISLDELRYAEEAQVIGEAIAADRVVANSAQRSSRSAERVAEAFEEQARAALAGGIGAGGRGGPPRPPVPPAMPEPPDEPWWRRPEEAERLAEWTRQTQERFRGNYPQVSGGLTEAKVRDQRERLTRQWANTQFDRDVEAGRLLPIGRGYARDAETGEYRHRNVSGPLNPDEHGEQYAAAQRRASSADLTGAKEMEQALIRLNQRLYDIAVAEGRIRPLGGGTNAGVDITRDAAFGGGVVHRSYGAQARALGPEEPGEVGTNLGEVESAFAAAERRVSELRDQQAGTAQQQMGAERELTAAERRAAEATQTAARLAGAERTRANQDLANQRAEFRRQQGRLNAEDPFIQRHKRDGQDYFIDRAGDQPVVQRIEGKGRGRSAVDVGEVEAEEVLDSATRELAANRRKAAEKTAANARVEAERAERDLGGYLQQQNRRGVFNNFLGGLASGGFGGSGGFEGRFDGLARAAGNTVKYSLLYSVINQLQQAAGAAVTEFLDMDDSVTELQVAMRDTSDVSASFLNNLQDFASLGGFNVGEAMDVASRGIRAFRTELSATNSQVSDSKQQMQDLGTDFAEQANRLAVLATTTLEDSAGNLVAISRGFELPAGGAGFRQVTDAIAGAKQAGGGDETQIYQGLANAGVILKEMGFNIREAATIISTLNKETDQSGQLLATRVSRLGAILEGESGKRFIQDINESRPSGTAAVDVHADARTQIGQLADLYQAMNTAQRQVLTSRLGGTGQAREILLLLSQYRDIQARAANDAVFDNAGAKEFELRLQNVRSQLTQIAGNIKAIITNLALSGLADPFVTLIEVIRPLSALLRDATQALTSLAAAGGPLTPVITNLLAVAAALKAVSLVRRAGGLGSFLTGAEQRLAPGRGLARLELNDRLRATAAPEPQPSSLAAASKLHAEAAIASTTKAPAGALQDPFMEAVRRDAEDLRVAAANLAAAEIELREAVRAQTLATTDEERQVAARRVRDAEQQATTARADLTRSRTRLDRSEARNTEVRAVDERFQGQVEGADRRFRRRDTPQQRALERIQGEIAATDPSNTNRLQYLQNTEATIRNNIIRGEAMYAAEIDGIRRRRRIAEEQINVRAAQGKGKNLLDDLLFGIPSAQEAKRNLREQSGEQSFLGKLGQLFSQAAKGDKENAANTAQSIGSTISEVFTKERSIGNFGKGLYGAVGGGPGVAALAVATVGISAFKLASSMDSVERAQRNAAHVMSTNFGTTEEGLRAAAEAQTAAAAQIKEATSGFFGGLADWKSGRIDPVTGQREGGRSFLQKAYGTLTGAWGGFTDTLANIFKGEASKQGEQLTDSAKYNKQVADSIERNRQKALAGEGVQALTAASSVDELNQVLTNLHTRGQSAAQIVETFSGALDNLAGKAFAGNTSLLSVADRQTLAGRIAARVPEELAAAGSVVDREDRAFQARQSYKNNQFIPNASPVEQSAADYRAFMENNSPAILQQQLRGATLKFLSEPGHDLASQATLDAYRQVVEKTLDDAHLTGEVKRQITVAQVAQFVATLNEDRSSVDPNLIIASIQALPTVAGWAGEAAGQRQQISQWQSGNPLDTSQSVDIKAQLDVYATEIPRLRNLLAQFDPESDDYQRIYTQLMGAEYQMNDLRLKSYASLAAEANKFLEYQKRRRANLARNFSINMPESQIAAAGNQQFTTNITAALATGNPDVILSVTDHATLAQRQQATAIADKNVADAQAKYDADKKKYDEQKEAARQSLAGAQEAYSHGYGSYEDVKRAKAQYDKFAAGAPGVEQADFDKRKRDAAGALAGAQEAYAHGYGSYQDVLDAKAQYDSIMAITPVKGPNAGALNAAKRAQAALRTALGLSGAPKEAFEEERGGTAAQIAAAREAAFAASRQDPVASAAARLHAASADLYVAKRDNGVKSRAYQQALQQYYEAQNAYNDSLLERAHIARQASIDLTNAVTVAREELRTAREKLASDQARNAAPEQLNRDRIDIQNKRAQEESALHSQTLRDAQNLDQLGEITHAQYIRTLIAERDRIQAQLKGMKDTDPLYDLLKSELIDSKLKIQAANKELSGQWNLGDIRVPTVYEVRRAVKNAQASTSAVNTAVIANTTNNTITINGADLAEVKAFLATALGAGIRYSSTARRG